MASLATHGVMLSSWASFGRNTGDDGAFQGRLSAFNEQSIGAFYWSL